MAEQIRFFQKNFADFEKPEVTLTASEGQDSVDAIIDRSSKSSWGTVDSTDAANTTIEIDFSEVGLIDSILLLKHNFKNFKVQYWDEVGLAWTDFLAPVSTSTCTDSSSFFEVTEVLTSKLLLTVYGTQTPDEDKYLFQFIATKAIGQLYSWPVFKKPLIARALQDQAMLSGKSNILPNVGRYSTSLTVEVLSDSDDLDIIEALFGSPEGFLFWPSGGSETQFSSVRQGYRLEDIYLCRCKNEWQPEWHQGLYQSGIKVQIDLVEVIT